MYEEATQTILADLPRDARRKLNRELKYRGKPNSLRGDFKQFMGDAARALTPIVKSTLYEKLCEAIGIFCLSDVCDSNKLWGYYTGHEGFAIGFDSQNEFFHKKREPDGVIGPVQKVQYRADGAPAPVMTEKGLRDMFFVKSSDYAEESEWRMLDFFKNADTVDEARKVHLFRVPMDAITDLILGYRVAHGTEEKLLRGLAQNPELRHVRTFRMNIREDDRTMTVSPFE